MDVCFAGWEYFGNCQAFVVIMLRVSGLFDVRLLKSGKSPKVACLLRPAWIRARVRLGRREGGVSPGAQACPRSGRMAAGPAHLLSQLCKKTTPATVTAPGVPCLKQ